MEIINDLYKPTIGFIPIGGKLGMGTKEAVYALKHYLTGLKFVIPMCFNIVPGYPLITGRPERLMDLMIREQL